MGGRKILVIRLSAIGDVAMTIPAVYSAARSNPGCSFTVLTQAFLIPVFINRPPNVDIMGINTTARGAEKSLPGLLRFAVACAAQGFDMALDLHDVHRTRIIRLMLRIRGAKVFSVCKARRERYRMTRPCNKDLTPLRPVTERYADVFRAAGLKYTESFGALFDAGAPPSALAATEGLTGPKEGFLWVGIAPFARHRGKTYPPDSMEQVVATLSQRPGMKVILFGGRDREREALEDWAGRYPGVLNAAGRYSLDAELALISRLDALISMDSANMHFASLAGATVISVWGATHPSAGFYGYRQEAGNAVQLSLPCRPCSVYGQKPCRRHDYACLAQLPPSAIIERLDSICRGAICRK
ncbi:MAG: glycosyltransferase family 9 protein [Tannerellaceae bacterium]|jgi:ADP-heptose:LPS heptosyltransferase|nr:glycosyltransferase family 9 protein [Tannerellaceae bacterium]